MQDEKNEQVNYESDPNRQQEQAQVPTKQSEKSDIPPSPKYQLYFESAACSVVENV